MAYHSYVLIRLSKVGIEYDLIPYLMRLKTDNTWTIHFCCHLFGAWDIMCEIHHNITANIEDCLSIMRDDEYIRTATEEISVMTQRDV